jgi:hypothetical protein
VKAKDIYKQLADHLSSLGMGYPPNEDLEEILRANLSPREAEVALALPTRVIPLQPIGIDEIMEAVRVPEAELEDILEGLLQKGLLFSGKTKDFLTAGRLRVSPGLFLEGRRYTACTEYGGSGCQVF